MEHPISHKNIHFISNKLTSLLPGSGIGASKDSLFPPSYFSSWEIVEDVNLSGVHHTGADPTCKWRKPHCEWKSLALLWSNLGLFYISLDTVSMSIWVYYKHVPRNLGKDLRLPPFPSHIKNSNKINNTPVCFLLSSLLYPLLGSFSLYTFRFFNFSDSLLHPHIHTFFLNSCYKYALVHMTVFPPAPEAHKY